MTTTLLSIFVLVELARLIMQCWSAKTFGRRAERTYCAASKMINIRSKIKEQELDDALSVASKNGYEVTAVTYSGYCKTDKSHYYTLFFTKKYLKNYTEI